MFNDRHYLVRRHRFGHGCRQACPLFCSAIPSIAGIVGIFAVWCWWCVSKHTRHERTPRTQRPSAEHKDAKKSRSRVTHQQKVHKLFPSAGAKIRGLRAQSMGHGRSVAYAARWNRHRPAQRQGAGKLYVNCPRRLLSEGAEPNWKTGGGGSKRLDD